jgi:hypothetical protein
MTTLYEAGQSTGGKLHALVIGVDHYPFAGVGKNRDSPWYPITRAVKPLTCATPSALAIVDWLGRHRQDAVHPVGSVELLVSPPEVRRVDGLDIERATLANVKTAFERWYDRCDRDSDDVALMYFCGHGFRIGSEDILLLEDFAAARHTPFDTAIGFATSYRGIREARAGMQCFLIDACRNAPDETAALTLNPAVLKTPGLAGWHPRDAPIIYSAPEGATAPASTYAPTTFAAAAVEALEGGAADHARVGWPVTTTLLGSRIADLLRWTGSGDEGVVVGGEPRGGTIHRVARPLVPFRFGCDPAAALPHAHLRLRGDDHRMDRAPAEFPWRDKAPANDYQLGAEFIAERYAADAMKVFVLPPYSDADLPAGPA